MVAVSRNLMTNKIQSTISKASVQQVDLVTRSLCDFLDIDKTVMPKTPQ